MNKIKKASCIFLALILLISFPVSAYASTASVGLTAGRYVLNVILDACGIDVSISTLAKLFGSWSGHDEYVALGEAGQLGAYSQWVYDGSKSAQSQELRESFLAQQEALQNVINASWGAVVNGIKALIQGIKSWLFTLEGYGTDATSYFVDYNPPGYVWGQGQYISTQKYPVLMGIGGYIQRYTRDNQYLFTRYAPSNFVGYTTVYNYYKPYDLDVVGVYNSSNQSVAFYVADSENVYKTYPLFYHYGDYTADGAVRTSPGAFDYNAVLASMVCSPEFVGILPFPVFRTIDAMSDYFANGVTRDLYEAGKIQIDAEAINTDVQNAVLKQVPDSIAIPQDEAAAKQILDELSAAMTDEAVLKDVLNTSGIAIDWGLDIDVPGEETGDKTELGTLEDILKAVKALPMDISAVFDKKLNEEITEKDIDDLKLPVSLADKFPFCIPFDIAYLVSALVSESETPRFELPMEFDTFFFQYSHVFVIDFSDYDSVVQIFRIMQDALFIAGLIVITRNLIRG